MRCFVGLTVMLSLVIYGCHDGANRSPQSVNDDSGIAQIMHQQHLGVALAMVAPDYSSSAITLLQAPNADQLQLDENLLSTTVPADSDIAVHQQSLYRIGRYGFNTLTRYQIGADNSLTLNWQYSVNGNEANANPYRVVFASDEKAYVIRYGANSILIINPSVGANDSEHFILGEIDLSHYVSEQRPFDVPNMADAQVIDGVLYVLLERLEGFAPGEANSYLVLIDTLSDSEITAYSATAPLPGIELPVKNAASLTYFDQALYLVGKGHFYAQTDAPYKYSGGIVKVDLNDHQATLLLDDGTAQQHPYGNIADLTIVNANQAYFVGSTEYGNDQLYVFDPASSEPEGVQVEGFDQRSIADIRALSDNTVLVAQHATPQMLAQLTLLNTQTHSVLDQLDLVWNPVRIELIQGMGSDE